MALEARDIEKLIREAFPHAQVQVQGDDGQHFSAEVIDESFRGQNRVQQQRAVYAALIFAVPVSIVLAGMYNSPACTGSSRRRPTS